MGFTHPLTGDAWTVAMESDEVRAYSSGGGVGLSGWLLGLLAIVAVVALVALVVWKSTGDTANENRTSRRPVSPQEHRAPYPQRGQQQRQYSPAARPVRQSAPRR